MDNLKLLLRLIKKENEDEVEREIAKHLLFHISAEKFPI